MKKIKLSDKLDMFIKDTTKEQLDKLIASEREAITLYKDAVNSAANDGEKELFTHILDEEVEHLKELENLRDKGEAKIMDSNYPNDYYKIKSRLLDSEEYMSLPISEIESKAKEIFFNLNKDNKDRKITYGQLNHVRDSIKSSDKLDLMVKLIKNEKYSVDDADYISEIIYKEKK